MEKFCYLGDTRGAIRDAFDSARISNRSGSCKYRDLVPFLDSRGFPLAAKGRSCYPCVHSFMPCEKESWLVKEEDVIRL